MPGFDAGGGSISRFVVGGRDNRSAIAKQSAPPGVAVGLGLAGKNPKPHRAGGEPRPLQRKRPH